MRFYLLLIFSIIAIYSGSAQVVINEASYRNFTQLTDDTGNNPDWIELYNAGYDEVNLWHYHLSDDAGNLLKWTLPSIILPSKQWILVYASGNGSSTNMVNHWETAVKEDDYWKWVNPDQNTSVEWMNPGFDDWSWNLGQGGFGYGDGDDRTVLPVE